MKDILSQPHNYAVNKALTDAAKEYTQRSESIPHRIFFISGYVLFVLYLYLIIVTFQSLIIIKVAHYYPKIHYVPVYELS